MANSEKIQGILDFLKKAEKLKTELRHSWTSDAERRESVADHTWMSCLFAMALFDEMNISFDRYKILKMIIVHDLGEAIMGDIPAFEVSERKNTKADVEHKAIREIANSVPNNALAQEIISLYEEFEERKTPEALLASAIDKAEVIIQHNIADISTWKEGDYRINPYYKDDHFVFDPFLVELKKRLNADVMVKVEQAGVLDRVSTEHKAQWGEQKTLDLS